MMTMSLGCMLFALLLLASVGQYISYRNYQYAVRCRKDAERQKRDIELMDAELADIIRKEAARQEASWRR